MALQECRAVQGHAAAPMRVRLLLVEVPLPARQAGQAGQGGVSAIP